MPVWSAGISGIGFSLASLVLLLPVIYLTTGSQFYQSHAYGDEAAWTPADYLHVMKYEVLSQPSDSDLKKVL